MSYRKIRRAFAFSVAVAAGVLPAAVAQASPRLSGQLGDNAIIASVPSTVHGLGAIPKAPSVASPTVVAAIHADAATLPSSVDLTGDAPPVGDQGAVGSCAAWATVYTALGYWIRRDGLSGGYLAPMYTYSQVDGGVDNGSTPEANLGISESQGVDTQTEYEPQGNFDYTDKPTATQKTEASARRLSTYTELTITANGTDVNQQSIEEALAAGTPVTITLPVYYNFWVGEGLSVANSGYYDGPDGTSFVGWHAVTAMGYNSTGLVIENSWGTDWADNGFATLSWSFVDGYVNDAMAVANLVSTPTVTAAAASSVTGTTATLSGTVNPNGTATKYQFHYGTTSTYKSSEPTAATTVGSDSTVHTVTVTLTGLKPDTTYHYDLAATNPSGTTTNGSDLTFSTPAPATVSGVGATNVTATSATLAGSVNPNATAATYQFRYGRSTAYGTLAPSTAATVGSDSSAHVVTASLTGLTPGTTYHYDLLASNGGGAADGADETFTTLPQPAATTGAASKITATSATISGVVKPDGAVATYQFQYGTSTGYGSSAPSAATAVGSSTATHTETVTLTGLTPGTDYHYVLSASAATGTFTGADMTFMTPSLPQVTAPEVANVTATSAILYGTVDAEGEATTYQFHYGTTASYGSSLPRSPSSLGSAYLAQSVAVTLTGLKPATTYHYQLQATNAGGSVTNAGDITFTTASTPPA